jgi:Lecithin retinol acyltransferase
MRKRSLNHIAQLPRRRMSLAERVWAGDRRHRLLSPAADPPVGSHLVTPRLGFTHHGIYVGAGRVVHQGSLTHHLLGGPVEEVSLARFAQGHRIWVRSHARSPFEGDEVIRRARTRIGETSYHLLSNNCEHFCEWCLHGTPHSYQVDVLLAPLRFTHAVAALLQRVPSLLARS